MRPEQPAAVEAPRSRAVTARRPLPRSVVFRGAAGGRPGFLRLALLSFFLVLGAICASPANLAAQQTPTRSIVFLAPGTGETGVSDSLREAVTAQLSDVLVRPVFEHTLASPADLLDFVEAGRAIAARENAVGVFWLDTARQDEWMLYLLDPAGERLLEREAGSSTESLPAAVEAVAVIIKGSTVALLRGQALVQLAAGRSSGPDSSWVQIDPDTGGRASRRVKPETAGGTGEEGSSGALMVHVDTPPGPVPEADAKGSGFRLAAAYRGADFAPQSGWQSGVGLWAGWIWSNGLYAGASYTFTGIESVRRDPLELSVQRHPLELFAGFRFPKGSVRFDAELGAMLDILSREAGPPQAGFAASQDRTRLVLGLLPRTRIEYAPFGGTALFAGLGISFLVNNFEYVGDFTAREVLLAPRTIRLELEAGLAVYLQ
jgi:hypothetical protein